MVVIGDDKITDEGSLLFSTHYAIGIIPYKHELP